MEGKAATETRSVAAAHKGENGEVVRVRYEGDEIPIPEYILGYARGVKDVLEACLDESGTLALKMSPVMIKAHIKVSRNTWNGVYREFPELREAMCSLDLDRKVITVHCSRHDQRKVNRVNLKAMDEMVKVVTEAGMGALDDQALQRVAGIEV